MGLLGDAIGLTFKVKADAGDGRKELDKFFDDVDKKSKDVAGEGSGTFSRMASSIGLSADQTAKLSTALPIAGAALAGVAAGATAVIATAGAVGAALFNVAKEASDYASDISDASQKTGLAVETMSALKYGADSFGSSFEQVTNAVGKFSLLIGDAAKGNEKAEKTLAKFSVTAKDALKDPDEALSKVLKKLGEMPDGFEKTNAAADVFGSKLGKELLPFINAFEGDLDKLIARGRELGLVLSAEDVKAADDFGDTLEILKRQAQGVTFTFAKEFMPEITGAMAEVSKFIKENKQTVEDWGKAIRGGFIMLKDVINFVRENSGIFRVVLAISTLGISEATIKAYQLAKNVSDFTPSKNNSVLPTLENKLGKIGGGRNIESSGYLTSDGAGKTSKKPAADSVEQEMRKTFEDLGFKINRTFGGAINSGSLHPKGLAVDVSHRGKNTEEIVNAIAVGLGKGWQLVDERVKRPGIKQTGPHLHFEKDAGKQPSSFLDEKFYGGAEALAYLKQKDAERLAGKTSNDEIAAYTKKQNEEEVKNRETIDKRILELAKNRAAEDKAILDNLLAQKLISEKDYADQVTENEINQLRTEKTILEERLQMSQLSAEQRAEIEQEIANVTSEIKVRETEKSTDAIKRETEELENQKKITEEIAELRRRIADEIEETERARADLYYENDRKVFENLIEAGINKRENLRELRDLENRYIDERADRERKAAARERDEALEKAKDLENERELVDEINALYAARVGLIDTEIQTRKRAAEEDYKNRVERETSNDWGGGLFGDVMGGIAVMSDDTISAADKMQTAIEGIQASWASLKSTVGDAVGGIVAGIGSMVESWVLYGNAGGQSLRKFTAQALASVASQSAVLAIFEAAKGFAALFFNPAEAAAHFTAAALFGSIAGVTAIAGRAIAGDSFQQKDASKQVAGAAQTNNISSSNTDQNRTLIEERNRRNEQAEFERNRAISSAFANVLKNQTITLKVQSNDSHIVDVVGANISDRGTLDEIIVRRTQEA